MPTPSIPAIGQIIDTDKTRIALVQGQQIVSAPVPQVANASRNRTASGKAKRDTEALLTDTSTTGGFWSSYDCKGDNKEVFVNTETIAQSGDGAMRDGHFIQHVDRDTTDYGAIPYRVISNGLRVTVSGKSDGTGYQTQYKDLHGGWFSAVGNTDGTLQADGRRGVSGVLGAAMQMGTGVATNEFAATNPTGSPGQAALLAGTISIVNNGVAANDATHFGYGSAVSLGGYRVDAAFRAASFTYGGNLGSAQYGLKLSELVVDTAGISMPASSGNQGTIISYDTNDYSYYDRVNNAFYWNIGGTIVGSINASALTHTPTVTSSSGVITTIGSASTRYWRSGKRVDGTTVVVITANGTGAGSIHVTLPFTAAYEAVANGRERGVTGKGLIGTILPGNVASIFYYDFTYPGADGAVLAFSWSIEIA